MRQPPVLGVRRTGHHGHPEPTPADRDLLRAIAIRTRQRRARVEMTQGDVSAHTGWSGTKVSNIENGRITPTVLDIEHLAEALHACPAWLAYGTGPEDRGDL